MFVGILLRDLARDFGVEFESLRHREIFEISARGQKTIGSHLKVGKEIGIKDIAYVAFRVLKKHQIKKTKENNVSMFQRLALF